MTGTTAVAITVESPESETARAVIRSYFAEIVGRYRGREVTHDEVTEAMGRYPNDDLVAPTGVFLLAYLDGEAVGCAGMATVLPHTGEVRRVYVSPVARGHGIARLLLTRIEEEATNMGLDRLRLDTRADLVEARRLYESFGYVEVERFNDSPVAAHWFSKRLPA